MDNKIILNVQIRQKIASLVNKGEYIVCGNDNYAIKFDFDDDFAGYKFKTAIFISQDDKVTEEVIFEGDTCDIPPIYDSKLVSIGVVADNVRTTTPAIVPCKLSISDLAGKVTPPSEDVYNQIMALLNQYIDKAVVTEEEVKKFVEEFLEGYEDIVTEKELADAVASVMAKINEQADDIKELESISTVIVEGVSALEEDVADIDDRVSYLESFNLDYTEVSADTGILPVPNNEFVGKKAFLNSFGGMTRRWEGITYTETLGSPYGVYSYGAPFTLQAGTYRLVGGMGIELHINDALVSNPFTLTEPTEITSFYEESGAVVGDGSTHTIYPYLLNIDTNTAIAFPNTWLGLQDTKPTEIKAHGANLISYPYHDTKVFGKNPVTIGGITYTVNEDGTILVNGTATANSTFNVYQDLADIPKQGSFTLSGMPINGSLQTVFMAVQLQDADRKYKGGVTLKDTNPRSFPYVDGTERIEVYIYIYAGTTINNVVFKPMLNIGTTALPYVPYKEPVTKSIPTAITALNGYGKGISAEYCNKVDLEEQTYTEWMETIVLDGVTNKFTYTNITESGSRYFQYVVPERAAGSTSVICSHLITSYDATLPRCYIAGAGHNLLLAYLENPNITTLDDANAWLIEQNAIGNPVTITYAKAEATTTALPVALDGLVEVEQGGFIEIVTDTGKGVPASATFVIPRE